MKVAVICDTHFGARSDSAKFAKHFDRFYDNVFFPYLKEHGIKQVIHLGDLFDKRRQINMLTLEQANRFVDRLYNQSIDLILIVGNHDCYYKNTNSINSPNILYGSEYTNTVILYDQPAEIPVGSLNVLFVPWINSENQQKSLEQIKQSDADILMGHLEINGFRMNGNMMCNHGYDPKMFKQFEAVYSGHFHDPSESSNIKYLGAPYEMDWSDYNGKRGFHVLDTETRELTFVENPYKIHHLLSYDKTIQTVEDLDNHDYRAYRDGFVKVLLTNKQNRDMIDVFVSKIEDVGADVKVVEKREHLDNIDLDSEIDQAQDTITLINQYVDKIDTQVNKYILKKSIQDLYQRVMAID